MPYSSTRYYGNGFCSFLSITAVIQQQPLTCDNLQTAYA